MLKSLRPVFTIYDELPEYAIVKNCPNCGVVSTYTGNCPYCGERLDA